MSILLVLIASPVSSAVYTCPSIRTFDPNGITDGSTAIVIPALGARPEAVVLLYGP